MKRLVIAAIAVAMLSSITAESALAHGGGLDSSGCHHNWADGSGDYHCHRGGGSSGSGGDWGTVAAILGGLLVVGLLVEVLSDEQQASRLGPLELVTSYTPETGGKLGVAYKLRF